jgi:hypothetical protein
MVMPHLQLLEEIDKLETMLLILENLFLLINITAVLGWKSIIFLLRMVMNTAEVL